MNAPSMIGPEMLMLGVVVFLAAQLAFIGVCVGGYLAYRSFRRFLWRRKWERATGLRWNYLDARR